MAQYFYLVWALLFFALWLVVFALRKDTRKEMLIISGIFALGGVLADLTNTQDWWHPLTITSTRVGFEAALIGFSIAGIAAVIYEIIYRKVLRKDRGKVPALRILYFLFFLSR